MTKKYKPPGVRESLSNEDRKLFIKAFGVIEGLHLYEIADNYALQLCSKGELTRAQQYLESELELVRDTIETSNRERRRERLTLHVNALLSSFAVVAFTVLAYRLGLII